MRVRRFEIGSLMNNTYVAWCGNTGHALIVDPVGRAAPFLDFVERRGLSVQYIVYTHAHPDHITGAAAARERTGARVAAHRESPRLMRGPIIKLTSGFGLFFRPVAPDMLVDEGDELTIGNVSLRVLHTPGHTPDSLCLAGHGAVFTGDLIMQGGVGRTDLPGGSLKRLQRSIRDKILPLGDNTILYPGHGPESTVAQEKKNNQFISENFI